MKRHHTAKKFIAKLPDDFQEVLMTSEMELQEGLTVPILRKLVYLYTRGMQYYDLVHKDKFRQFYSDKLIALLTRKDVEQFLDKNPINFDDKKDLDKLFSTPQKKQAPTQVAQTPTSLPNNSDNKVNKEKTNPEEDKDDILTQYYKAYSSSIRRNSTALVKNKINTVDIGLLVKEKILEVSTNLNKIDKAMTNEVIEQMTEFESNKRQREVRKSPYIINKSENKENENNNDSNSEKSNSDEEKEDNNIITAEDELKILELSGINKKEEEKETNTINTPTKNTIGNNPMLREIEIYVQKNMDEMYQALEELKASFQDEIKEAEENGFDDIAEGLKEDLQSELDNLKEQYEEQRRVETEKIKAKYSKRNSLVIY
jgi:hypothetical protein